MRLPNESFRLGLTLGLMVTVAACGGIGSASRPDTANVQASELASVSTNGPEADYPVVIGDAYKIDGIEYVPADVWNYDEVGYATLNPDQGVTAAHKTLPLPSYVEVTSLENGKTIVVRVESRGPMTNERLIGLSAGAQALLGATEGTAIRVRRINPPEVERAALRSGQAAPDRLDTPMSLVEILKRKLPAAGSASLAKAEPVASETANDDSFDAAMADLAVAAEKSEQVIAVQDVLPTPDASEQETPTVTAVAQSSPEARKSPAEPKKSAGDFVIQAAAFSSKANADRAAKTISGFVESSGKLFRVRTGPYETRGQADAALAKVRAAGYSDARVIKAG